MPPRAIWSGAISFGLVNVPVRMYPAIEEKSLHFHLLHVKDDSRIGYEKVCKKEGKPIPDDEIAKAYETSKGNYVYLDEGDFAAAATEGYKTIEITDFVPYEEIDPIYFEKTSYLAPQEGGEKVYSLLVRAMEDSELAAIATFVMREKQHLGCLRVRKGVLALERMYFADEIRPLDEIKPQKARVSSEELEMAATLIERFSGHFRPETYKDTYRQALLKVIRAKQKGKEIHVEPPEEAEEAPDLLTALRASLEERRKRAAPRKRAQAGNRKRQRKAA